MKYDVRICKCGRIHFIDEEEVYKACETDKNLLVICGNCGNISLIGADIDSDIDENGEPCTVYSMYSSDLKLGSREQVDLLEFIKEETSKPIHKVIYSDGKPVYMNTGLAATGYMTGSGFTDMVYPDFYKIQRKNVTAEEVMKFIDDYNTKRTTVNMQFLISSLSDEQAEALSHFCIAQLNWAGTKWATDYNSK